MASAGAEEAADEAGAAGAAAAAPAAAAPAAASERGLARSLAELQEQLNELSEAQQGRIVDLLQGHVTEGAAAFEVNLKALPLAKFRELTRRVARERREAAEAASAPPPLSAPAAGEGSAAEAGAGRATAAGGAESGSGPTIRAHFISALTDEDKRILASGTRDLSGHQKRKRKELMEALTKDELESVIGRPWPKAGRYG